MCHVMMEQAVRLSKGKGMQNMNYPPEYDDWCHVLACIRPEAYRVFSSEFAGRSERSFQMKRSVAPNFVQGVTEQCRQVVQTYLETYCYPKHAPLAFAVDDTKLLPGYRPYYDPHKKQWFIVGGAGAIFEVNNVDALNKQLAAIKEAKATKVRLWALQILLPHIPPCIVAVTPIGNSNSATELAQMEMQILDHLVGNLHLTIISLGSDGTVTEREARRELVKSGYATLHHHCFPHPDSSDSPQTIKIPIYTIHGQKMVPNQDSKHARKTMRNNAFSGARCLVLGGHVICYQHVREIVHDTLRSPLYVRDVEKMDRQDDRAAARLFSASTLDYVIEHMSDYLGLASYVFVFGDMVDAYQSRTISHFERAKVILRARFFKDLWKKFLQEAGYPANRYYLSRDCDDILDTVIESLLGLQIIHRDHLEENFPLLPWMHGTEMCEHIFGFMRQLIPDFTMLDILRAVPKLAVRLRAACAIQNKSADFRRTAAGYSHTYFSSDSANLNRLSDFPTDEELTTAAKTAWSEAVSLWGILGYFPEDGTAPTVSKDQLAPDEEDEDESSMVTERRELQNALDSASTLSISGTPASVDAIIDECTFAAASLELNDLEKITSLPNDDPESLQLLQTHVMAVLNSIASSGTEAAVQVEQLLASIQKPEQSGHAMTMTTPQTTSSIPPAVLVDSVKADLSGLVQTRYTNQSRECAESVRIRGRERDPVEERREGEVETRRATSEHKKLARKIYEIIRLHSEQGTSTGLNRRERTKAASGSNNKSESTPTAAGNTANAKAAAQSRASRMIKQRRKEYKSVPKLAESLATAQVDLISKIKPGIYGIVLDGEELRIGKVITMYEKGGGSAGKHAWTPESGNIGSLSYIVLQVWQQVRPNARRFTASFGSTTHLSIPQFSHLPSSAFLHRIPESSVHPASSYLDLEPKFFDDVFVEIYRAKSTVVQAFRRLQRPTKKGEDMDDDQGHL
ncbi:hypothetical protein E1B28_003937 [Marasmius oreades]|uniref:Uncharacterized protein n=1 Tax=Marasmius oreades TaxID=181124 RepID=A0A9P8ACB8_9AGAR|nr:uncharacterized protein E1B28_003937 [Marasmius oreades]KAG7096508.1 hypothetical protein E1B28_003937 [Marasmius oreades]